MSHAKEPSTNKQNKSIEVFNIDILCANKFKWNWSKGSGEKDENVKRLQTDKQTDC